MYHLNFNFVNAKIVFVCNCNTQITGNKNKMIEYANIT